MYFILEMKMENIDNAAEPLVNQTQRAQAFLGLTRPNSEDLFFLTMEMTGAGKSTFVSQCTGSSITIGHCLFWRMRLAGPCSCCEYLSRRSQQGA